MQSSRAPMMDIIFISPEIVPFSKVGGLGDVAGSLPKALRALGHKVTVVSLLYGSIDVAGFALARRLAKVNVPLGGETVAAEVYESRLPSGVQVTPPRRAEDERPARESTANDTARRTPTTTCASPSSRAGRWSGCARNPRMPDVVHAHDWPAALVPAFLKRLAARKTRGWRRVKLCVHPAQHRPPGDLSRRRRWRRWAPALLRGDRPDGVLRRTSPGSRPPCSTPTG